MLESIQKYVTAYASGDRDTKPVFQDKDKHFAVKLVPNYDLIRGTLITSDIESEKRYLGIFATDPVQFDPYVQNGWVYYNTEDKQFYVELNGFSTTNQSDIIAYYNTAARNANWAMDNDLVYEFGNTLSTDYLDEGNVYIFYSEEHAEVRKLTGYQRAQSAYVIQDAADIANSYQNDYLGVLAQPPIIYNSGDWLYHSHSSAQVFITARSSGFVTADNTTNRIDNNTKVALNSDDTHVWTDIAAVKTAFDNDTLTGSDLDGSGRILFFNADDSKVYQATQYTQTASTISSGTFSTSATNIASAFKGSVSTDPSSSSSGDWVFNTTTKKFKISDGTSFSDVTATTDLALFTGITARVAFEGTSDTNWADVNAIKDAVDAGDLTASQITDSDKTYVFHVGNNNTIGFVQSYTPPSSTLTTSEITTSTANENYKGTLSDSELPHIVQNGNWYYNSTDNAFIYRNNNSWENVTQTTVLSSNIRIAFHDTDNAVWTNEQAIVDALDADELDIDVFNNNQRYVFYDTSESDISSIVSYNRGLVNGVDTETVIIPDTKIPLFLGTYNSHPEPLNTNDFYYNSQTKEFRYYTENIFGEIDSDILTPSNQWYIGQHATDEEADDVSSVIIKTGDFYWNTTEKIFKYWDMGYWKEVIAAHRPGSTRIPGAQSFISTPSNAVYSWDSLSDFKATLDNRTATSELNILSVDETIILHSLEDNHVHIIFSYRSEDQGEFSDFDQDVIDGYNQAIRLTGTEITYKTLTENFLSDNNIITEVIEEDAIMSETLPASNSSYLGTHANDTDANTAAAGDTGMLADFYWNTTEGKITTFITSWFELIADTNIVYDHRLHNIILNSESQHRFNSIQDVIEHANFHPSSVPYIAAVGTTDANAELYRITEVSGLGIGYRGIYETNSEVSNPQENQWYYNSVYGKFRQYVDDGQGSFEFVDITQALTLPASIDFLNYETHYFDDEYQANRYVARLDENEYARLVGASHNGVFFDVIDNTTKRIIALGNSSQFKGILNNAPSVTSSTHRDWFYIHTLSAFADRTERNTDSVFYGIHADDTSASNSPAHQSHYFNTTNNQFRYYDDSSSSWKPLTNSMALQSNFVFIKNSNDHRWNNITEAIDAIEENTDALDAIQIQNVTIYSIADNNVYQLSNHQLSIPGGFKYLGYETEPSTVWRILTIRENNIGQHDSSHNAINYADVSSITLTDNHYYWNTTENKFYYFDGSYWEIINTKHTFPNGDTIFAKSLEIDMFDDIDDIESFVFDNQEVQSVIDNGNNVIVYNKYNSSIYEISDYQLSVGELAWRYVDISAEQNTAIPTNTHLVILKDVEYDNDDELIYYLDNSGNYAFERNFYIYYEAREHKVRHVTSYDINYSAEYQDEIEATINYEDGDISGNNILYYDMQLQKVILITGYTPGLELDEIHPIVEKTLYETDAVYGKLVSVDTRGLTCRVAISGSNVKFAGVGDNTPIHSSEIGRGVIATDEIGKVTTGAFERKPKDLGRVVSGTNDEIHVDI